MSNGLVEVFCRNCEYRSSVFRGFYCPLCGSPLEIRYSPRYSIAEGSIGVWRYSSMLPYIKNKVSLGEGFTPLIESSRLFSNTVFYKDEGRNPTGSFRDRAAALIVSDALDQGARYLLLASDGNMGASIAAYGARAGLRVTVYVPPWIDDEKIMLMKAYGANILVRGKGLDELLRIVEKRSRRRGYYNASSTYNILSIHGLKTIAYEIYGELKRVPRTIVLPLGSGLTLYSIHKGFKELLDLGIIDRLPRFIGVETCGNPLYSSKLYSISRCGEEPLPGLAYSKPVIMDLVVNIIQRHGEIYVVNRRKAVEAAKKLAWFEGIFIEPSSAVALAGALENGLEDYSVILLTGHGLKGPSIYSVASRSRSTALFPGSTKRLILDLLREKPGLTGYMVWKMLGLKISVQAVYQHLHDLVEKGYLRVVVKNGLKHYYPAQ